MRSGWSRWWMGLAAVALTACGGGGGGGAADVGAGCTVVAGPTALQAEGGSPLLDGPQVQIEVRFLTVSDTFYDSLGFDWNLQVTDDPDPLTPGGSNADGTSFGTWSSSIGGVVNTVPLVPQGQSGRQILPMIHPQLTSRTPGFFMSTNLPTQGCLTFLPDARRSLDGLDPVPGGQELPSGGTGAGVPIRLETLDDPMLQALLGMIQSDGTSELVEAPTIIVRDGQQAVVQATTEFPLVGELQPEWEARFDAMNAAIGQVQTGPALGFETRLDPGGSTITLRITPALQMASVDWPQTFQMGGIRLSGVEVPVVKWRGARSRVTLLDDETIVLGGVLNGDGVTVDRGVPILADLPVLGSFSRSDSTLDLDRNLLIFVTARLVDVGP